MVKKTNRKETKRHMPIQPVPAPDARLVFANIGNFGVWMDEQNVDEEHHSAPAFVCPMHYGQVVEEKARNAILSPTGQAISTFWQVESVEVSKNDEGIWVWVFTCFRIKPRGEVQKPKLHIIPGGRG